MLGQMETVTTSCDRERSIRKFSEELGQTLQSRTVPGESICLSPIFQNNGVRREACVVRRREACCSPVYYLDDFYEEYHSGDCGLEELADRILGESREQVYGEEEELHFFRDYEQVRETLSVRLIGIEKNRERLREIPYECVEDMAVVCFCRIPDGAMKNGSIMIRHEHLEAWGISEETLRSDAFLGSIRRFPPVITGISDILGLEPETKEEKLYVLTNTEGRYGAACCLYPGILEKFSAERGTDLFVLPCSVHEVLLLPECPEEKKAAELREIVMEINRTELAPEEVLTDSVYCFDRKDGRFFRCALR